MREQHTVHIDWQFDKDSPVEQGQAAYTVANLETTIVFPSGETMPFDNWDILGCRERHYREEFVEVEVEDLIVLDVTGRTKEFGVEAKNVQQFVRDLAKKPRFEHLFIVEKRQAACV